MPGHEYPTINAQDQAAIHAGDQYKFINSGGGPIYFFGNGDREPQLLQQELRRAEQQLEALQAYVRELRRLIGNTNHESIAISGEASVCSKELTQGDKLHYWGCLRIETSVVSHSRNPIWASKVDVSHPGIISGIECQIGRFGERSEAPITCSSNVHIFTPQTIRLHDTYFIRLYLERGHRCSYPRGGRKSTLVTVGTSKDGHWWEVEAEWDGKFENPFECTVELYRCTQPCCQPGKQISCS